MPGNLRQVTGEKAGEIQWNQKSKWKSCKSRRKQKKSVSV